MRKLILLYSFISLSLFLSAQEKTIVTSCYAPQRDMLRCYWHSEALIKASLEYEEGAIYFKPVYIYRDTSGSLQIGKSYPLQVDGRVERDYVLQKLVVGQTYRLQLERQNGKWFLEDQMSTSFGFGKKQLRVQFAGYYHYFEEDRELKELLEYYTLDLLARPLFDPESRGGQRIIAQNSLIRAFEEANRNYHLFNEGIVYLEKPDSLQREEEEAPQFERAEPARRTSSSSVEMSLAFEKAFLGGIEDYRHFLADFNPEASLDSLGISGKGLYRLRINPQGKLINIRALRSLGALDYSIFHYLQAQHWQVPSTKHSDVDVFIVDLPFKYPALQP